MSKVITGSCCCGNIEFTVEDKFSHFYFCHCVQCRKLTGSAHASNLFTSPENIHWLKGAELTTRYDHPERSFSKVFCTECGSSLPFLSQNGKTLVVPAGCLDEEPIKQVDAQIFFAEQADWHQTGLAAAKVAGFPK